MADFSDTSAPGNPENTDLETMQDDAVQLHDETGNHDLVARGTTVIDRGRRGARHKIIILSHTDIDHHIEE